MMLGLAGLSLITYLYITVPEKLSVNDIVMTTGYSIAALLIGIGIAAGARLKRLKKSLDITFWGMPK